MCSDLAVNLSLMPQIHQRVQPTMPGEIALLRRAYARQPSPKKWQRNQRDGEMGMDSGYDVLHYLPKAKFEAA